MDNVKLILKVAFKESVVYFLAMFCFSFLLTCFMYFSVENIGYSFIEIFVIFIYVTMIICGGYGFVFV